MFSANFTEGISEKFATSCLFYRRQSPPKWAPQLKDRISSNGSKIIHLELPPLKKGKNEKSRIGFCDSVHCTHIFHRNRFFIA